MATKNFKNLGANPVQDTLTPGKFNNALTDIPRQQLPYDCCLGGIMDSALRNIDFGDRVYFKHIDQHLEGGLIDISQVEEEHALTSYTIFTLKPGHLYKLRAQVICDNQLDNALTFAWFDNKDVAPGEQPSLEKRIGREGRYTTDHQFTPAVGVLDTSEKTTNTSVVCAFYLGDTAATGGANLKWSYFEIENITDKTGPWV